MKDKLKDCIDWLKGKGVEYADCRMVRRETESIRITDGDVDTLARDLDVGIGIRVLVDGAWGFAATAVMSAAELKKTANKALQIAKASAMTKRHPVVLAEQKPYVDVFKTKFKKDPFKVSTDEKLDLF
jgi:TldD protein